MICPKCGEVNASTFLFCGMCGTMLGPARKASAPAARAPEVQREVRKEVQKPVAVSQPPAVPESTPMAAPPPTRASAVTPPIAGPSVLGLSDPNMDMLRDRAFSGLDSYAEETKPKRSRILLMILLLLALGGGYWWTYNNYLRVTNGPKPQASQPTSEVPEASTDAAETSPPKVSESKAGEKSVNPPEPAAQSTPAKTSETADTKVPAVTAEPAESSRENSGTDRAEAKPAPKVDTPAPKPARHEVSAERVRATKPAPPPADQGDALFKKGQSYLYARGGGEDCPNALKYLKMASEQSHAKARSMMGTMYATGHCVPRDLPSSYRWFASALRVDPNNAILEKDLSAVWNQMTPPERQLATKSQ